MQLNTISLVLPIILFGVGCTNQRANKSVDRLEAAETRLLVAVNTAPSLSAGDLAKIHAKWSRLKAEPDTSVRMFLALGDAQAAGEVVSRRFANAGRAEEELFAAQQVMESLTSMRRIMDKSPKNSGGTAESDTAIEGAGLKVQEARLQLEKARKNATYLQEFITEANKIAAEWAE